MTKNICIECGWSMVDSSNLYYLLSIQNPLASFLSFLSYFLHHRTSILLYSSSIFLFPFFFLCLRSKMWGFDSRYPQNSVIYDKMSASAACTAFSFFQVCLSLSWSISMYLGLYQPSSCYLGVRGLSRAILSYRVSGKTVNAFISLISWLSRGLEIPSWTMFKSPFHVDSKTIHLYVI